MLLRGVTVHLPAHPVLSMPRRRASRLHLPELAPMAAQAA